MKKENSMALITTGQRRVRLWLVIDLLSPIISIIGLYIFAASFFLVKRSLPNVSHCDEADVLLQETLGLTHAETNLLKEQRLLMPLSSSSEVAEESSPYHNESGCWMERSVESMIIVVVDALRFDFAMHHLPLSIGARLSNDTTTKSRLLQFVADPPTVTMQRLKAMTTGGLPTFSDISGNFGGGTVDEDSWLQQLKDSPYQRRGLQFPTKLGFVGDDTWVDLYPNHFDQCHPYPSFNTRDLHTVDNGCLAHLPHLLDQLRTSTKKSTESKDHYEDLELVVAHFLGVDHVGHTYGPHDIHMDTKLRQMDTALNEILQLVDKSTDDCQVVFIFGDHGMTEDGNHGGGTEEEINAALFVHFAPACGDMFDDNTDPTKRTQRIVYEKQPIVSDYVQTAFQSIHQIDLVPTLALLLGIPIPYANLGGLVPSLLPFADISKTALALALNSAQVWRYLTIYSSSGAKLPGLEDLKERLNEAVSVYKNALTTSSNVERGSESTDFYKACSIFKLFLMEALELGQRVWACFDMFGMVTGALIVFLGLLLWTLPLCSTISITALRRIPRSQLWEVVMTSIFIVFQCAILTFGNSYIVEEEHIMMFMLAILGVILFVRMISATGRVFTQSWLLWIPLLLPFASRISELFVSGHGLDPSVGVHAAYHPGVFLVSLAVLFACRLNLFHTQVTPSLLHTIMDCLAILFLAGGWLEKRNPDQGRNGFMLCRGVIFLLVMGIMQSLHEACVSLSRRKQKNHTVNLRDLNSPEKQTLTFLIKIWIAIMTVTGPSSAATMVLYCLQSWSVHRLSRIAGSLTIPSYILAAIWRMVTRHVFFSTNHGCYFNRLQYSAAFVATNEFNFVIGGISLYLNTFGWELSGLVYAWLLSMSRTTTTSMTTTTMTATSNYNDAYYNVVSKSMLLFRWYCFYQLLETFTSCVSVFILRRHLFVWDIYAPHFLFVSNFMILTGFVQIIVSGTSLFRFVPPSSGSSCSTFMTSGRKNNIR